jgi:tRNA (adenine58-N1)-methyltransferase non-catalytic subunit
LKEDCVMMRISETWMREYQVLPLRTHPQMKTSATGGYILNGIKVIKE